MNRRQLEIAKSALKNEKDILKTLEKVYAKAASDCEKKIQELAARPDMQNLQSIVYQKQYQQALKNQINGILEQLHSDEFTSITDYLTRCYDDGFIGALYDLHGQNVPLLFPINQNQVIKAVQNDVPLSEGMYKRLGEDITKIKKSIQSELSRGIANGSNWFEMATQISKSMNSPFRVARYNSQRIARTEGHRVQQEAQYDSLKKAQSKGADVVKQWDATLDKRTRPSHRRLDGQIRELDEYFEVNGHKALYPGAFGVAGEDIHCRCGVTQRARWALDEDELKELKARAEYFDLDKSKDFQDFKKKYLNIYRSSGKAGDTDGDTIINEVIPFDFSDKKAIQKEITTFMKEYADSDVEHAIVISPLGQLFRLTGGKNAVDTILVGEDALIGSIGAHNHPVWHNIGFDSGDSFSLQDVKFSVEYKTGIEYLVTGNKKYSFEYTGNLSVTEIYTEYKAALFEVNSRAFDTGETLEFEQEAAMRVLAEKLEGFIFNENL